MKFENLVIKDGKTSLHTKGASCGHDGFEDIPDDVVKLMKKCGCSEHQIAMNFREYCLKNSWFSSFGSQICDICGKDSVLCWYDGCSPSGENVISPSNRITFWPTYDYPQHEIRICSKCMPDNDSKESRNGFLKKLFIAMQKNEDDNWQWKTKNKI